MQYDYESKMFAALTYAVSGNSVTITGCMNTGGPVRINAYALVHVYPCVSKLAGNPCVRFGINQGTFVPLLTGTWCVDSVWVG